jgi:hypothetical protein
MEATLIRHDKVTDELGNTLEIRLWKVPPSPDKPKGYKYSLVYIVEGERVIGYDNSERKGDHRHYGKREEPYDFSTLRQLADDFLSDVEQFKRNSL